VAGDRDGRGVDRDLMEGEVGEAEAVDSLEVEDVPRLEVEAVNKLEVQEVCRHGAVAVRRVRHEMGEVSEGYSIDRRTALRSLRQATWSRWQGPPN
jgi:hypothetical protein